MKAVGGSPAGSSIQQGKDLLDGLKTYLLRVLAELPECQPAGRGLGNAEIERRAGLELNLDKQDHWLCWSILKTLQREGKVEALGSPTRWRLKAPLQQT